MRKRNRVAAAPGGASYDVRRGSSASFSVPGNKRAIAATKPGGGGSIVNVASVSGIKPSAGASAYCASKAASQQFFSPQEVAATILYLASDEASHLSGAEIVLDRGHG